MSRGGETHRFKSTGENGMELNGTHFLRLTDLSDKIRRSEISPIAVTEALLDRIATYDRGYGSYITVLRDRALAQAASAADEIRRGFWRGPLHGIPLGLKDLCDTNFAPTAAGMPTRRTFVPAANATVVDRLEAAGAVILGKLSMSEGAFSEHRNELPVPVNPWNGKYWTGTSSSGSAVATAAGFCFGAIASDTGGSIRYPAACQGITGLKPTWGRVSRHGIFPLAPTLDHVGPMARTAADCAVILAAIAGPDPRDPTAAQNSVPDYLGNIGGAIGGLRIGFDPASAHNDARPEVGTALARMLDVLAGLGARIVEIEFPPVEDVVAAWVDLCACEVAAVHKDNFDAHAENYGAVLGSSNSTRPRTESDRSREPARSATKLLRPCGGRVPIVRRAVDAGPVARRAGVGRYGRSHEGAGVAPALRGAVQFDRPTHHHASGGFDKTDCRSHCSAWAGRSTNPFSCKSAMRFSSERTGTRIIRTSSVRR